MVDNHFINQISNTMCILAPGQVEDLTVGKIKDDYRTAYVSWSLPALRKHNGVLVEYLFSISNDEVSSYVKEFDCCSKSLSIQYLMRFPLFRLLN